MTFRMNDNPVSEEKNSSIVSRKQILSEKDVIQGNIIKRVRVIIGLNDQPYGFLLDHRPSKTPKDNGSNNDHADIVNDPHC